MPMNIYQAAEDSYLLQEFVRKHAFGRVLDLGTGSGIQALTAARNKDVREVVAVDINDRVVRELKERITKEKLRKITAKKSDLFSNVKGKLDTIVFNPPYLPQDKGIEDRSIYGGKKGWEISERFFDEVNRFLAANGKILYLFSSLTNKEKIEGIISRNLLDFKELERKKLPLFEELYVYLIQKSEVLRELERKNVEQIKYFTHGKRGDIFTGYLDKSRFVKTHFPKKELVKVAIKIKRKESEATERIKNEAKWLKILNKKDIGPRMLFYGKDYLVYEFVEGKFILDWVKERSKKDIKKVLINILEQCFILDKLGVNKEEMHHPLRHIVIDKSGVPTLLDFERCNRTKKPKNVTQFVEFICRIKSELEKKRLNINVKVMRDLAKTYKEDISKENLERIINSFF